MSNLQITVRDLIEALKEHGLDTVITGIRTEFGAEVKSNVCSIVEHHNEDNSVKSISLSWWSDKSYKLPGTVKQVMREGSVSVDGIRIAVYYRFIDEDTISCTDMAGGEFITSYKSLLQ